MTYEGGRSSSEDERMSYEHRMAFESGHPESSAVRGVSGYRPVGNEFVRVDGFGYPAQGLVDPMDRETSMSYFEEAMADQSYLADHAARHPQSPASEAQTYNESPYLYTQQGSRDVSMVPIPLMTHAHEQAGRDLANITSVSYWQDEQGHLRSTSSNSMGSELLLPIEEGVLAHAQQQGQDHQPCLFVEGNTFGLGYTTGCPRCYPQGCPSQNWAPESRQGSSSWQAGQLNLTAMTPPETAAELEEIPTLNDMRQIEMEPESWTHLSAAQHPDQQYADERTSFSHGEINNEGLSASEVSNNSASVPRSYKQNTETSGTSFSIPEVMINSQATETPLPYMTNTFAAAQSGSVASRESNCSSVYLGEGSYIEGPGDEYGAHHIVPGRLRRLVTLSTRFNLLTTLEPRLTQRRATGSNLVVPEWQPPSTSPSPTPSIASVTPSHYPDVLSCQEQGCEAKYKGKYRLGTLQRHMRQKHGVQRVYYCGDPGCNKSFQRSDARLKHYRNYHRYLAPKEKQSRSTQSGLHHE
jgi:hypothetical protein